MYSQMPCNHILYFFLGGVVLETSQPHMDVVHINFNRFTRISYQLGFKTIASSDCIVHVFKNKELDLDLVTKYLT